MHETGCSRLVPWDNPEGWDGEGTGGRGCGSGWRTHVHLWWIHVNVWQNQYNIVKWKKKERKPWRYRQFMHVHKDNGDIDTLCMYMHKDDGDSDTLCGDEVQA